MHRVLVEASASSANLGPGFDVFALSLREPVDVVEGSVSGTGQLKVEVSSTGSTGLPSSAARNAAGAVALDMGRKFKLKGKVGLKVTKGVPVGVGLGSSGASSAAAAVAMDRLFGLELGTSDLVASAGAGEKVASGAAHLDNVAASIMGGFVIVPRWSGAPVKFEAPPSLKLCIVTPRVNLPARKTEYARSLIPEKVELAKMVGNVSRASLMVAGFAKKDIGSIGKAMEDEVVEPARAVMVPGLGGVKRAARDAGAAGACLSGAGPSVLALVDAERNDPEKVLRSMIDFFKRRGSASRGFITSVGDGARVVESS